jgi:hypothetical protein
MNVVGHPHIGMNKQPVLLRSRNQCIAKELVIRLDSENRLSIIAALNDVLGLPQHDVTR